MLGSIVPRKQRSSSERFLRRSSRILLKDSIRRCVEAIAVSIEDLPVTCLTRSGWWMFLRFFSEIDFASRSERKSVSASSRRCVVSWIMRCFGVSSIWPPLPLIFIGHLGRSIEEHCSIRMLLLSHCLGAGSTQVASRVVIMRVIERCVFGQRARNQDDMSDLG